ncbi:pdfr-1 [Pristionchus pacificus]|uniref:Pdfr-1 n=1 Tax=Pristionchus pacificus TaxID=54126 RepID=A0A2A6CQX8_PRIPA|nr:pdfr-1 [Pristionchus pacificus]|eukprot:PDM80467.1 pdfr-1 [Pristionchus pacificus]
MAMSLEDCHRAILASGGNISNEGWCPATFDTVLCWPSTPPGSHSQKPCPPLKGLDPSRILSKGCDRDGRWSSKNGSYDNPWGWTNYTSCFRMNFDDVLIAQEVAKNARKLEFVGLGLSLVSLLISIFIFSFFRRLRVFRNLLHLQLMIAILMVVIIRLILYIDLIFTDQHRGPDNSSSITSGTINTTPVICESMFFLLEYFKTVAFGWSFLEGFYLHNQLVLTVFASEPKLMPYLLAGYGIPLVHASCWLLYMFIKNGKLEKCLGSYYLEMEFWILDGPRMGELLINLFFICNVIRVLWSKVRDSHNTSELERMKKSVKAALMLIPLLGIPNIMQTIPFSPTKDNIMVFAIWTYCASFTYMYQGLMITIIYCFTNKEVNTVLKGFYSRYRLTHTSTNELRRGSRSMATHYHAKNGTLSMTLSSIENNNHNSPQPKHSKAQDSIMICIPVR